MDDSWWTSRLMKERILRSDGDLVGNGPQVNQGVAEPKSREVQIVEKMKAVLEAGPGGLLVVLSPLAAPAGHGIWLVLEHAGPRQWPFVVQQLVNASDGLMQV